jgi:hypothetical protein
MKNQKFSAAQGRSTIEMLGVLTIMGLLTIFGIFGYTQAMEKLYLNKQAQQVSDLFAGVVAFTTQSATSKFSSASEMLQTFVQLGYMPDSMVKSATESDTYLDYFGNSVLPYSSRGTDNVHILWYFASTEQFVNIAQTLQRFSKNIYFFGFINGGTIIAYGDRECGTNGKICFSAMSMTDLYTQGDKYPTGTAIWVSLYRK